MTYIPDPIELLETKINTFIDKYIDDNTCMECGKTVDYELICPSPIGDGPAICIECLGFDPFI